MATFTKWGQTWTFTDGKKDFDTWIAETPEREDQWETAAGQHVLLKLAQGDSVYLAGNMFQQWIDYAGASQS